MMNMLSNTCNENVVVVEVAVCDDNGCDLCCGHSNVNKLAKTDQPFFSLHQSCKKCALIHSGISCQMNTQSNMPNGDVLAEAAVYDDGCARHGSMFAKMQKSFSPQQPSLEKTIRSDGCQVQSQSPIANSSPRVVSSLPKREVSTTLSSAISIETSELEDICWDDLGFNLRATDYMYVMKSSGSGEFSQGELRPYGNIELSPAAGILNYGQGIFEGLKAYRRKDGSISLFRPEENALRMRMGAERMCMQSPTVEQFVEAVKLTVLANRRWVPPMGKGSLYVRPLLMGSGAGLGPAPSTEHTFLIYVSPVGNYFKEGLAPIHLVVENEYHRATPGGTGGVKAGGNYAPVMKPQSEAKAKGYSDVLYLDSVHKKYLEEVSACNVFLVKGKTISTPEVRGTILPGITRKSIIDLARNQGFQVEERLVTVDELLAADEVFCTGTAVVVLPVGSVTYLGKKVSFGETGVGAVSQQLYSSLTSIQTGLAEDKHCWTLTLD